MSSHSPVRTSSRGGQRRLIIDFSFTTSDGRRRRYRRDASVQTMAGARVEAQRLIDLAARTGSPFASGRVPAFGEFVRDIYRPVFMPKLRPGTRGRYEGILRQGLLDHLGKKPLDAIAYHEVLVFAAALQQRRRQRALGNKDRGVDPRGPVNFVKSVLRAAVQARVLPAMPELPNFPEAPKLPGAPSREHVGTLLAKTVGWLRAAVALQALAGLRQGEVRALEVGDVDLERCVLTVRRAYSEQEVVMPKGNRQRVVPMHPDLVSIVRGAVQDKLARALVVPDENGRPVPRQRYLARLKAAQRRLGLEEWSSHSLRHHFCSELTRAGANVEAVRALAGHSNLGTTQRYLHATGGDLVHAIGKLGNGVETT